MATPAASFMRALISLFAGFGLLAAASSLSYRMAEQRNSQPFDIPRVPSGRAAQIAALGNRSLASDLYWLAAVQYIGEPRADARGWDSLFPLIDLVTDLDPRHGYAYQTAGIVLSAAGRLEESDSILRKGMEKGPDWWSFPYYIAFNNWFYRGDFSTAAHYAEVAASKPGASPNVSHLALSLASKSGSPEHALTVLRDLRTTVQDEATAKRLDEQIGLAIVERDAQRLERAVAQFESQRGWPLTSLDELTIARIVPELPPDPFGGRYLWDASSKKVRSSVHPFRFQLDAGKHVPKFQYRPRPDGQERPLK